MNENIITDEMVEITEAVAPEVVTDVVEKSVRTGNGVGKTLGSVAIGAAGALGVTWAIKKINQWRKNKKAAAEVMDAPESIPADDIVEYEEDETK